MFLEKIKQIMVGLKKISLFWGMMFFAFILNAQNEARLLRFPNVMNNQVVFTYAGDLYTVDLAGGVARRLTSDVGFEMFAKISPDGKMIAFTAQYDGNTEVYLMPAGGGVPKRLTYTATLDRDDVSDRMGPNNIVMGWTPDSKNVIFRSRCVSFNSFRGQLYTVSVDGDMPVKMPIEDGGFCSMSADGKYLAFNKIFREFRTWKYYKGGMADDIWVYDYANNEAVRAFENPAQDIFPMWSGNSIYFASDRDRIMNLFVFDTYANTTKKVTNFDKYDVKFPSIGGDKIIFENGGFLYYYDIATNQTKKITIYINNDFASSRNKLVDAKKRIQTVDLSPKGNFFIISARGELFMTPVVSGVTKNITNSSGVHERNAIWSPDGKYIAYISDKTGEFEIFMQKADLSEPAIQLTDNAETYKYSIKWSPDSKKILWCDKMLRLRYIDINSKKITEVDKSNKWEIRSFNWSPDSRWITYSLPNFEMYNKIMIYDTKDASKHEITQGWYPSSSPAFSFDGKYLVFKSARSFSPTYDNLDWNTAYSNMQKVYLVLLSKTTPNPLAPSLSFVSGASDDTLSTSKTKDVKIDFDGIFGRVIELPIRASNYWNLYCLDDKVFYNEATEEDVDATLYMYDLKKRKEVEITKNVTFHIPWNGKKMILLGYNRKVAAVDIPSSAISSSSIKYADLSGLKYITDYSKEYKQIYDEAWRQMRDFFYDPNMHGVNWDTIYQKYAVLLPYVKHRNDLSYIIGEMIGELSIGHAYVGGGERPSITKIYTGLLGGLFSKDASGYFKIDKILRGASWTTNRNSPLAIAGLDVNEGDFIVAINGVQTNTVNNIYQLLVNTAGKSTELMINSKPSMSGARSVVVVPLKSEADLYYYEWVQHNIDYVNQKSNGQVGYIHIPDMSSEGMDEFVQYFYPQLHKKALIIDDRGNGGGNVSPIITEILRRQMVMQQMYRNVPMAGAVPEGMHVGPKVLLLDEYSASDGDLFPYQFKFYKIGTTIGKRSWGGVTGIRGSLPFIDGGYLYKPEFGHYSADGKTWIIEGYGVDPDIVVDNNPVDLIKGIDAQLDTAIDVVLKQIPDFPDKVVPHPPFPDKSGNN